MIDILYEFMKQNISVNEIMIAISSINKQPITDNIPSLVSNKAELTEEEAASSQYQSALNVQVADNTQSVPINDPRNLNTIFSTPQISGGRTHSTPLSSNQRGMFQHQ